MVRKDERMMLSRPGREDAKNEERERERLEDKDKEKEEDQV